jgi:hypothetical protein
MESRSTSVSTSARPASASTWCAKANDPSCKGAIVFVVHVELPDLVDVSSDHGKIKGEQYIIDIRVMTSLDIKIRMTMGALSSVPSFGHKIARTSNYVTIPLLKRSPRSRNTHIPVYKSKLFKTTGPNLSR